MKHKCYTVKRQAFITLKDNKTNFKNKPSCRPINHCKPELTGISEQIVEKIVLDIKSKTSINSWKNTKDVIASSTTLTKRKATQWFALTYVISIHPYRPYAQQFTSKYSMITDEQAHIIKHTMKFMLYKDGNAWCKKKTFTKLWEFFFSRERWIGKRYFSLCLS